MIIDYFFQIFIRTFDAEAIHNKGFYEEISKLIPIIKCHQNTKLNSSSDYSPQILWVITWCFKKANPMVVVLVKIVENRPKYISFIIKYALCFICCGKVMTQNYSLDGWNITS